MEMHDFVPSRLLRPFIKTYKIIETRHEVTNRVLPNTSIVIAFRYRGHVNYLGQDSRSPLPQAAISGLQKSVRLINYHENSATLLVIFKEAGAAAFFKEPMHELFGHSISLDGFADRHAIEIVEEQLSEASKNIQRIAIIEQFLLTRIIKFKSDPLIIATVNTIQATKGIIGIKALANASYISQDALEKRFRKMVGATPKQFANIVRMNTIIANKQSRQSLLDIALEGGYYDQPHFNKDFKLFTGQPPADFFKAPTFW
jgi:AraC-like DNA-binding protein